MHIPVNYPSFFDSHRKPQQKDQRAAGCRPLAYTPANNAMQGPCGPCKGCPYGTHTDLAAGAAVARMGLPHEFHNFQTVYVNCSFFKIIKKVSLFACFNF